MKYKTFKTFFVLMLIVCMIGIVIEYIRITEASRKYAAYETQVETGLLARLAAECLDRNDLAGFKNFCRNTFRYNPALSSDHIEPSGHSASEIFTPPAEVMLQTRISLFDGSGKVLFDSWLNADKMENHSHRPEFLAVMNESNTSPSFYAFERFSTTTKKVMFFCITRFQAGDNTYLLRTGNTVQSLKFAGSSKMKDWWILIFWFLTALSILVYFSILQFRLYREKLLEIEKEVNRSDDSNFARSNATANQSDSSPLNKTVQAILGGINDKNRLLEMEKNTRDAVFDALTEGVVLIDVQGRILDINENAARLFNTKTEKAIHRPLTGLWRSPELQELIKNIDSPEHQQDQNFLLQRELVLDLPEGKKWLDVHLRKISRSPSTDMILLFFYDLTRIRRLEGYRKDFIANVSHEIKTPLTVILGTTEALQESDFENPQQTKRFLDTLELHAHRLLALVQDILSLSNLETNYDRNDKRFENCPLSEPLDMALASCDALLQKKRVEVIVEDLSENQPIRLIPQLMEQVFVNLIDNAVKYSDPKITVSKNSMGEAIPQIQQSQTVKPDGVNESKILKQSSEHTSDQSSGQSSKQHTELTTDQSSKDLLSQLPITAPITILTDQNLRSEPSFEKNTKETKDTEDKKIPSTIKIIIEKRSKDQMAVMISDHGPGIPSEHRLRIFERFYRVDSSRNSQTGGTGLGLAIVKHIVQLHGGTVSVDNNPEGGCTFTILLPR